MYRIVDLTGQKFGRLTVIERLRQYKHKLTYYKCKCDCGNIRIITNFSLKSGVTRSCGCLSTEKTIERSIKHNMTNTKLFKLWTNMKQRCYNPNYTGYINWGGRGIGISVEFRDNFQAFYDYVSVLPHYGEKGYTLDRIDNNGNYERGNLRWATQKEQSNNKRSNHLVTYNGETKTLIQWAEKLNMNYATLKNRISRHNWDIERALTLPVAKQSTPKTN